MKIWILALLVVINCIVLFITREPENLTLVKQRYQVLVDYINNNDVAKKFKVLGERALVVGRRNGDLGYNVNKGFEIGICLDGTVNDMFHILLHELSHSTVAEYSHSDEFWKNFGELKDLCIRLGIYEKISGRRAFCGKYIQD